MTLASVVEVAGQSAKRVLSRGLVFATLLMPRIREAWVPAETAEFSDLFPTPDCVILFHHEWNDVRRICQEIHRTYPMARVFLARDDRPAPSWEFRHGSLPVSWLSLRSCMQRFIELSWDELNASSLSAEEAVSLLRCQVDRLAEAGSRSERDYILLLEADSCLRGPIKVIQPSRASEPPIECFTSNEYPRDVLLALDKLSPGFPLKGWGFVIGLIPVKTLQMTAEYLNSNRDILENLAKVDRRIAYLDFGFPIVWYLAGGQVTEARSATECLRNWRWPISCHPLLHQYRELRK